MRKTDFKVFIFLTRIRESRIVFTLDLRLYLTPIKETEQCAKLYSLNNIIISSSISICCSSSIRFSIIKRLRVYTNINNTYQKG